MKYIKKVTEALKDVYHVKRYYAISFSVALALFLFNALINNYRIILSDFSFKLFFFLLIGTLSSIATSSLIMLIVMSILTGIVIAMTIFLLRRQTKGVIEASSSGLFVSIIAPACPSCAIGLLSVLGLGGFLAVLPFKGLELGVLGVILLIVSVIYLSNKITTKTCKVK